MTGDQAVMRAPTDERTHVGALRDTQPRSPNRPHRRSVKTADKETLEHRARISKNHRARDVVDSQNMSYVPPVPQVVSRARFHRWPSADRLQRVPGPGHSQRDETRHRETEDAGYWCQDN